jgi:immune inhibitor A
MGLVAELLQRADEDVDYSQYDNDDNGVVEALFVVHAGLGAEVTGSVNDIWSHSAGVPEGLELDGMRFAYYAMEPEDGLVGVFGHELGHSFFGLPDLYDVTYQSAGVGVW